MILQTSPGHKFVYQQTLIVLRAISDEFHKIPMVKLTKKINFSLQYDDEADVSISQKQRIIEVVPTITELWSWEKP